jgi:hypothetical protein
MAQQLFHEYGLYPIHAAAAVATAAKFARAPDRGTERAGTVNGGTEGRGAAVLSKLLR